MKTKTSQNVIKRWDFMQKIHNLWLFYNEVFHRLVLKVLPFVVCVCVFKLWFIIWVKNKIQFSNIFQFTTQTKQDIIFWYIFIFSNFVEKIISISNPFYYKNEIFYSVFNFIKNFKEIDFKVWFNKDFILFVEKSSF